MTKQNAASQKSFAERLSRVCGGLNFVSETDSPVEPVFGKTPRSASSRDVLAAIGVSSVKDAEEANTESFFSRLTGERQWFSEAESKNAKRFRSLKRLLESELTNLKVIRVGKIRVTIFVLGIGEDGRVGGVKMESVET